MNKTRYAIIALVSLLIILVVIYLIIYFAKQSGPTADNAPLPTVPVVTISELNSTKIKTNTSPLPIQTNTTITPPESMGRDVDIPEALITMGSEREDLMNKSPIVTADFVVSYDYKLAKYVVKYTNSSLEERHLLFEEWRELNYPNIELSDFIFQK